MRGDEFAIIVFLLWALCARAWMKNGWMGVRGKELVGEGGGRVGDLLLWVGKVEGGWEVEGVDLGVALGFDANLDPEDGGVRIFLFCLNDGKWPWDKN